MSYTRLEYKVLSNIVIFSDKKKFEELKNERFWLDDGQVNPKLIKHVTGLTIARGSDAKSICEATELPYGRVSKALRTLVRDGFVHEGLKTGRYKSYILTSKGFLEINRVRSQGIINDSE